MGRRLMYASRYIAADVASPPERGGIITLSKFDKFAMKRSHKKTTTKQSRDAERLMALVNGLVESGSRAEDSVWEAEIQSLAIKAMDANNDTLLNAALDDALDTSPDAHDSLAEIFEACAESAILTIDERRWQVLLLGIPMVAWSRYAVPSGSVPQDICDIVATQLNAHVLAADTRATLCPFLYSVDQMPRDFANVRKLMLKLGEAAITQKRPNMDLSRLGETAPLPADTRFLIAAVAAPLQSPLFRWQEKNEKLNRAECLAQWLAQGRPNLARLLPGCEFDCWLPDAFFTNCREADRRVRPYALRAAVGFLEDTLKLNPQNLRAIVARVGEESLEEYRVAFSSRGQDEVLHGMVWPIYGSEEDEQPVDGKPTPREEIEAIFKQCQITDVLKHGELFAPEYCEDCGAPLFVDADKDMVHPEIPEEADAAPTHYH